MASGKPFGSLCSEAHYEAARAIGAEGIVLLKNDGDVLPIADDVKKILVVGENAIKMMTVGGGSSSLKVQREISPLQGLMERYAGKAEVVYERGYVGDVTGEYNGVVSGQDLSESRSAEQLINDAVTQAKTADIVIFFGGLNKAWNQDCEAADRKALGLPYEQDKVIEALAAANPRLVVVNISGNAVAMPWVSKVPAILQGWYIGSEAGHAIADVLSGDVNPSGKLPFTFPVKLEDCPAHSVGEYVGEKRKGTVDVEYKEGIFVGYRWADMQKKVKPLFAFGHGLSYTQFEYGNPVISAKEMTAEGTLTVSVDIKNIGSREGQEIVQFYIADKKSYLPRPVKELKAFDKVRLAPGETATVTFTIDASALSFFDDAKHEWVAEPGKFEAIVAAASDDIKGKVAFELK